MECLDILTEVLHAFDVAVVVAVRLVCLDVPPEGELLQMEHIVHGAGTATRTRFSGNGNYRFEIGGYVLIMEASGHVGQHLAGSLREPIFLAPLLEDNAIRFATVAFDVVYPQG